MKTVFHSQKVIPMQVYSTHEYGAFSIFVLVGRRSGGYCTMQEQRAVEPEPPQGYVLNMSPILTSSSN